MHIHTNNSLQLASLGAGREEAREIAVKRAAEVRRKLSTASRAIEDLEEFSSATNRVEARSYGAEQRQGEAEERQGDDDAFGRLFSVKA